MNPFSKLGFVWKVSNALLEIQKGIEMKTATKIVSGIVTVAALVLQTPAAQTAVGGVLAAHPNVSAILAGVSALLMLLHNPQPAQQ